ncbi:MAG: cytochrome c biogenesis protein CcdA [Chloroflexota bacterium]
MDTLTPLVAFVAGVLSFVSPCVLPLVPVYIGNLAGSAVMTPESQPDRSTFFQALAFVTGFSVVFISLGALAGLLGWLDSGHLNILRMVGGAFLILAGITMTGILRVPLLYKEAHARIGVGKLPGYLRSLFLGTAFALGWTPCVGPVLAGILTLAWSSQTAWQGILLLLVYCLGLGLPFMAVSLALVPAMKYLRALNRHMRIVSVVGGIMLIALGVLMLSGQLGRLSGVIA